MLGGRLRFTGGARMYSGALGKTGNCQAGVSVHTVTDWASAPVNRRLLLPASWDDALAEDAERAAAIRRRRAVWTGACRTCCQPIPRPAPT
jgi:SRSO17 transposase